MALYIFILQWLLLPVKLSPSFSNLSPHLSSQDTSSLSLHLRLPFSISSRPSIALSHQEMTCQGLERKREGMEDRIPCAEKGSNPH